MTSKITVTSDDGPVKSPKRRSLVGHAVRALRPKQWHKNVFLLPAIIFSFHFTSAHEWMKVLVGVAAFCLVSSAGYVLNDIRDREADRAHPTKRFRPIAAGDLPLPAAWMLTVLAALTGFCVAITLGWQFTLVLGLYFVTTLSYSLYFKHVVILDVMFITTGFLWRAVAGAVAIEVDISPWFLLCAAFLALFLGFNKRRGELEKLGSQQATRKNLAEYSPPMLRDFQAMTTSGTVICYALYTVSDYSPTPWLLITLPYVLYGIFRYIYLVDQRGEGGAPDETLVRDKGMLATGGLYAFTVVVILLMNLAGWV